MGIYGININASDVSDVLRGETYWTDLYNLYPTGDDFKLHPDSEFELYPTGDRFEDLAYPSRVKIQEDLMAQLAEIERSKSEGITNSKDWFAQSLGARSKATQQGVLNDFVSANVQKSAILGSNLGQGYKESMIGSLDTQLDKAYETWYSNHRNNNISDRAELKSTIAGYESAAEQARAKAQANAAALQADISAIEEQNQKMIDKLQEENIAAEEDNQKMIAKLDKALLEESENYVDFSNSILDYADWLFTNGELDASYFSNADWQKYFMGLNGYIGSTALTEKMYDVNENGDYVLNDDGRMIINMLMNNPLALQTDSEGNLILGYGYDSYIEEKNPELAKWLMSDSAYSTEDTPYKNNMDYALKMLGLDAVDYVYKGDMVNPETKLPETYEPTPEGYRNLEVAHNDNNHDKSNVEIDENGNTNYHRGADVGLVATYTGSNNTPIVAFEELEVKAFNLFTNWDNGKIDNKDGEKFKMEFVDDSDNKHTYNLELVNADDDGENIVKSDNAIYKDIQLHAGNIVANRLYGYHNDIYAAVQTDSGIVLRRVQSADNNNDAKKLIQLMNNNSWGRQYSAHDVYSGRVMTTKTDAEIKNEVVERRVKQEELEDRLDSNRIKTKEGRGSNFGQQTSSHPYSQYYNGRKG